MKRYVELGKKWAAGHKNRMIKVPATPAGLEALEGLAAAGMTLNVTLIFTERQYRSARDAIWRGRQQFGKLEHFKSVYSIFVSRVDVYTEQHVPALVAGRARPGGHRQRQADLAREPGVLGRQETAAGAGNDLRQHRHQEAERPALEICGRLCRQRHRNQSAGHERRGGKERPDVHAAGRSSCRRAEVLADIDAPHR